MSFFSTALTTRVPGVFVAGNGTQTCLEGFVYNRDLGCIPANRCVVDVPKLIALAGETVALTCAALHQGLFGNITLLCNDHGQATLLHGCTNTTHDMAEMQAAWTSVADEASKALSDLALESALQYAHRLLEALPTLLDRSSSPPIPVAQFQPLVESMATFVEALAYSTSAKLDRDVADLIEDMATALGVLGQALCRAAEDIGELRDVLATPATGVAMGIFCEQAQRTFAVDPLLTVDFGGSTTTSMPAFGVLWDQHTSVFGWTLPNITLASGIALVAVQDLQFGEPLPPGLSLTLTLAIEAPPNATVACAWLNLTDAQWHSDNCTTLVDSSASDVASCRCGVAGPVTLLLVSSDRAAAGFFKRDPSTGHVFSIQYNPRAVGPSYKEKGTG